MMHNSHMHDAIPTMKKAQKPSKQADRNALVVRVDLKKILTPDEQASFAANAEKEGRTINEHFLAITLGEPKQPAA